MMNTNHKKVEAVTGTSLLLAIALLVQSLRIFFPYLPRVGTQFLIGSLVGMTEVLAAWRYGLGKGLVIAWVTPCVAFIQGMLPLPLFIPIVGVAASGYVAVVYYLKCFIGYRLSLVAVVAALVKCGLAYGGFSLLFIWLVFPLKLQQAILLSMGWPQIVTGSIGVVLAQFIMRRLLANNR